MLAKGSQSNKTSAVFSTCVLNEKAFLTRYTYMKMCFYRMKFGKGLCWTIFVVFYFDVTTKFLRQKKCDIQALLWPLKSAVLLLHIIISVIHIYDFKNKINSYFITSNFYI